MEGLVEQSIVRGLTSGEKRSSDGAAEEGWSEEVAGSAKLGIRCLIALGVVELPQQDLSCSPTQRYRLTGKGITAYEIPEYNDN